jgi:SAM-dependent methyltransferase
MRELAMMQNVAQLCDSSDVHAGRVMACPAPATAYDKVGVYNQDAVNGFTESMLNAMLDIVNPGQASHILDAMAGNGNLTLRLYNYCQQHGIALPKVTLLELSKVQCAFAKRHLAGIPVQVVWGDILTLEDYESHVALPERNFDRVMIKSGSHEIPLARQLKLYNAIFHALRPGGMFINLGFLFDDVEERDQFRELTRFKDRLAGLESAVSDRHFLTRDELYTRLQQAGFTDIRCGMHVSYTIRMRVAVQTYFPPSAWEYVHAEMQAQQAKAMILRRKGRIHFQGDSSIMMCPGEITVACRPR